jgi:hypothetical protein
MFDMLEITPEKKPNAAVSVVSSAASRTRVNTVVESFMALRIWSVSNLSDLTMIQFRYAPRFQGLLHLASVAGGQFNSSSAHEQSS